MLGKFISAKSYPDLLAHGRRIASPFLAFVPHTMPSHDNREPFMAEVA